MAACICEDSASCATCLPRRLDLSGGVCAASVARRRTLRYDKRGRAHEWQRRCSHCLEVASRTLAAEIHSDKGRISEAAFESVGRAVHASLAIVSGGRTSKQNWTFLL